MMRRTFIAAITFDTDDTPGARLPIAIEVANALSFSTVAEALSEAAGCNAFVCLANASHLDHGHIEEDPAEEEHRDRSVNPRVGDQTSCRLCGADIEYHGRQRGSPCWLDRGGNRLCGGTGPKRLHKPAEDHP